MSALDDYDALYDSAYWRVQDENQQLLHDVERLEARVQELERLYAKAVNHANGGVAVHYLRDRLGQSLSMPSRASRSADAMVYLAFEGELSPRPSWMPADRADLARCERTYEEAPVWLRDWMLPILDKYREHVEALGRDGAA